MKVKKRAALAALLAALLAAGATAALRLPS